MITSILIIFINHHHHYSVFPKMYPHQQQQLVPFTNYQQQQQYYSSSSTNPFLWAAAASSLPSDSSTLQPPGTEPVSNPTVYDPNSTLSASVYPYGAQPSDSQNLVVNYDAAVVSSSNETSVVPSSFPLMWDGTWLQQHFTSDATVALPNQTQAAKSMRCEVCKIDCNSKDVYERHILGKKHQKNLQMQANPTNTTSLGPSYANVQSQTSGTQGQMLAGTVDSKKRTNGGAPDDSATACLVCNIVCNSQEVYKRHLFGKKHAAQVALMSNNGIGPYIAAFKREGTGPWKKPPKKIKVVQPSWCDVCEVNCNSPDIYITHIAGKKHLKNLEKLSELKNGTGSGAAAASALQGSANPIIGPQEKPATEKPKAKKAPEIDIQVKRRKVVEGGAAAADIRLCTLCNVVCNSEVVYNDHLSGHKHAAMVKKLAESRVETTTG